jgi:hypothetical protein
MLTRATGVWLQLLGLLQEQSEDMEATIRRLWLEPSQLQLHELLGQGSCGQVFRATHRQRQEVAAKLLLLPLGAGGVSELLRSSEPVAASLRRELVVLARGNEFSGVCRCAP